MICTPWDKEPPSAGNGTMIGLTTEDDDQVDQLFAKASELGGRGAGDPGERHGVRLYAAYVRDVDNNKLGFLHRR